MGKLFALVILLAGAWAVLATLFTPPLTSGWREGVDAVVRRWPRAIMVVGLLVAGLTVLWLLMAPLLGAHGAG